MKRTNINTIAEILVDRLDKMEEVSLRIEKASKRELKIDLEDLKILNEKDQFQRREIQNESKSILSRFKEFKNKNNTRVSNPVVISLIVLFLLNIGLSVNLIGKLKSYGDMKKEAEFYEMKYLELKKNEK